MALLFLRLGSQSAAERKTPTAQTGSAGVGEFLSAGCVLENRTLFCDVVHLPAATISVFKAGSLKKQGRYFCADQWESQSELSVSDFQEAAHEALTIAVRTVCQFDFTVGNIPHRRGLTHG
jgi:hypothetical protein